MAKDSTRLMHALFLPAANLFQACCWRPSADVYRCSDGWVLKFDLAGVRPEDVGVSVQGRRLTVRGHRRDEFAAEGRHHYYQMEITYDQFERSIELPCDLEAAQIATDYRDGMLLISIRTEEAPS